MIFPCKYFTRFHHSASRGVGQNPGANDQFQHGGHLQRHGNQGAAGETSALDLPCVPHRMCGDSNSKAVNLLTCKCEISTKTKLVLGPREGC